MTTNSAESELIESRNAEAVQSPEQKAGEELLETLRQRLVEARLKRSEAGVNPRGSGSGSYGDCNEYMLPMKLVRQPNAEGNQPVLNVVARHYVKTENGREIKGEARKKPNYDIKLEDGSVLKVSEEGTVTQKRTEDGKEAWVPLEVDMIGMLKERIRLSDVELNLSPEKKEANTSRLLGKIGRFFQGY